MDKLAEKLHQLPKFEDEKESNLGYIFGVSGPGNNFHNFSIKILKLIKKKNFKSSSLIKWQAVPCTSWFVSAIYN
jgi:hypothetical protein